jgi:hypothetical protein
VTMRGKRVAAELVARGSMKTDCFVGLVWAKATVLDQS